MTTTEEDYVEQLLSMNTHDYILFFSNKGKVYRLKGYKIAGYEIIEQEGSKKHET